MAVNTSSSEINLSKRGVGFPYYQEQLDLLYAETKRPSVYQVKVRHSIDCTCCYRGPDYIVDRSGPKLKRGSNKK
jgi:hypothetical protein